MKSMLYTRFSFIKLACVLIFGFLILLIYPSINTQNANSFAHISQDNNLNKLFFATLKRNKSYLRQGASRNHKVILQYNKRHLPLEVIARHKDWWRVRDFEGNVGWMYKHLLSINQRMALINPWAKEGFHTVYETQNSIKPVALLEKKLLVNIVYCSGKKCRIEHSNVSGYIDQDTLWGVYPNEIIYSE